MKINYFEQPDKELLLYDYGYRCNYIKSLIRFARTDKFCKMQLNQYKEKNINIGIDINKMDIHFIPGLRIVLGAILKYQIINGFDYDEMSIIKKLINDINDGNIPVFLCSYAVHNCYHNNELNNEFGYNLIKETDYKKYIISINHFMSIYSPYIPENELNEAKSHIRFFLKNIFNNNKEALHEYTDEVQSQFSQYDTESFKSSCTKDKDLPPIICFEGGEGTGKTTTMKDLQKILEIYDIECIYTREPGGSGNKVAEDIRNIAVNSEIDPMTETLLISSSRSINVNEIIRPALKDNKVVLLDRSYVSSLVYQGYVENVGVDKVDSINRYAIGDLDNTICIYFDIDPEKGLERISNNNRDCNKFDNKTIDFHNKVREGYKSLDKDKYHIIELDASLERSDRLNAILNILADNLTGKWKDTFTTLRDAALKDYNNITYMNTKLKEANNEDIVTEDINCSKCSECELKDICELGKGRIGDII